MTMEFKLIHTFALQIKIKRIEVDLTKIKIEENLIWVFVKT